MLAAGRNARALAVGFGVAVLSLATLVCAPASAAAPIMLNWALSNSFGGTGDAQCAFGEVGDKQVSGDWNGDGVDGVGVFRNGTWYLSNFCNGYVDAVVQFGSPGDIPIVGDWDGNGTDTVGVFRQSAWYLTNDLSGYVHHGFFYGNSTDIPVVGDWDGNGTDTVGIVRNSDWALSDSLGGAVSYSFNYGIPGDVPVAGDWNGDGRDTPGIFRDADWAFSNWFGGSGDINPVYGIAGDLPAVGDWDGNGTDTPGIARSSQVADETEGAEQAFFNAQDLSNAALKTALEAQGATQVSFKNVSASGVEKVDQIPGDAFELHSNWADWYSRKGKQMVAFYGYWNYRNDYYTSGGPRDVAGVALDGFDPGCWRNVSSRIRTLDYYGQRTRLGFVKSASHQRTVMEIADVTPRFGVMQTARGMGWTIMKRVAAGCPKTMSGRFYHEHNEGGGGTWTASLTMQNMGVTYAQPNGVRTLLKAAKINYYN